jgi:hypothetical protein
MSAYACLWASGNPELLLECARQFRNLLRGMRIHAVSRKHNQAQSAAFEVCR